MRIALVLALLAGCSSTPTEREVREPSPPRWRPGPPKWSLPRAVGTPPALPSAVAGGAGAGCAVGHAHAVVPLAFTPGGAPFAHTSKARGASFRLQADGVFAQSGSIGGWTVPSVVTLRVQRPVLLAGVFIPDPIAELGWTGHTEAGRLGVTLTVHETEQTITGELACDDVKTTYRSFDPRDYAALDQEATYAWGSVTATHLTAEPHGDAAYALPPDAFVTVIETRGDQSRMLYGYTEGLLLGWAPASSFQKKEEGTLGGGGRGEGIGLCGFGTIGHSEGVVRCEAAIPIIAELGDERRVVGQQSELHITAGGDRSTWTEVVIHDLVLVSGARIVVRTADLAGCEAAGWPPPLARPESELAGGC